MSARHTPGPWRALIDKPSRRDHQGTVMVVAGGQMAIDCNASGDTFEESKANAILIAAAPDLLAALRKTP
jgi:hypothetical protein